MNVLRSYAGLPRAVYILALGTFVNRAGTLLMPFLTLYLVNERGLGPRYATWGLAAYGAGSILGALIGGYLADRIGRRPVMIASLLGGAGVLRVLGDLTSPPAILAAVVVFTILADMYRPAAAAMIGDLVGPTQRPQAFGLIYLAINLGFAIGAVVGGTLATVWFTWLFWLDAATAAAFALIILFGIAESRPVLDASTGHQPHHGDAATPPRAEALAHLLRDHTFLLFCMGSLCCGIVFMQWLSTFPIYVRGFGIGADTYGHLIAINGIMIVLLQIPVAGLVGRYHRGTVLALSALVLGAGFGITALMNSAAGFACVVIVATAGELMQAPLMPSVVNDLAPVAYRARYMGVFTMCFSSANMIGAPLGGEVLSRWGGRWLWGGCVGVAALAALLFVSIRRRLADQPAVA